MNLANLANLPNLAKMFSFYSHWALNVLNGDLGHSRTKFFFKNLGIFTLAEFGKLGRKIRQIRQVCQLTEFRKNSNISYLRKRSSSRTDLNGNLIWKFTSSVSHKKKYSGWKWNRLIFDDARNWNYLKDGREYWANLWWDKTVSRQ